LSLLASGDGGGAFAGAGAPGIGKLGALVEVQRRSFNHWSRSATR
jgi:hypothetical protein